MCSNSTKLQENYTLSYGLCYKVLLVEASVHVLVLLTPDWKVNNTELV